MLKTGAYHIFQIHSTSLQNRSFLHPFSFITTRSSFSPMRLIK